MNIKQERHNEKLTVFIAGSIDTATSTALIENLQQSIEGVTELILDFTKVEYISSAGLRALLLAQKAMNVRGEMKIVHANADIMETFRVTCFNEVLNIVED